MKKRKDRTAPLRTEIRILFSNICYAENKKNEVAWWLEAQKVSGSPVDAYGMAETMLSRNHDPEDYASDYTFTQNEVASQLNNNPHVETNILYTRDPLRPTITEPNVNAQHKGVSWVKIDRSSERQKDIAYGAAYLPNRSTTNSLEYSLSIVNAINEQVQEHRTRGCVIVLAMDANIPFKGPNTCSKNMKLLDIILKTTNLVVLNWTEMASGFFTRHRADQKSQLDLMLVDRELLPRVKKLIINREVNFGSDHCILDLRISASNRPSTLTQTSQKKSHEWNESCADPYSERLNSQLTDWMTQPNLTINRESDHINDILSQQRIDDLEHSLVKAIKDSYDASVPHNTRTNNIRQRRAPGIDHAIRILIQDREWHENAIKNR